MRTITNLNQDWMFIKKDVEGGENPQFDTASWEAVSIPHTWNAEDGYSGGNNYFRGACWYRKIFVTQIRNGQRVALAFKAANSVANVYLNGVHLGEHRGGYSAFRFDITDLIREGANLIAVRVDNSPFKDVYPIAGDHTFFGGIYRDVHLVVTGDVHFDLFHHGSDGVYISQTEVSQDRVNLEVRARIANRRSEDVVLELNARLNHPDGREAGSTRTSVAAAAGTVTELVFPICIENPVLWHGLQNPYLYTLTLKLGEALDVLEIPIGLRYFHVDPETGFNLNGQPYPLHGVNCHQDRQDLGNAITDIERNEDMTLIKEVGANSIRMTHYQYDHAAYDLADREGMVIWAEIPVNALASDSPSGDANALQQLKELILQNFNHPSICFWGIQNEVMMGVDTVDPRPLVSELADLARELDPTRPVTMANQHDVAIQDPINRSPDILGYNIYYGWYYDTTADSQPFIEEFHRIHPDIPLAISEYGAEGILQFHSDSPLKGDYTEEYQLQYHEEMWRILSQSPYLWATYLWNMFDFASDGRNEGGLPGRNYKGLVTYDRRTKKDSFYWYKANWSDVPFIHIKGKRYAQRYGARMWVKVYSNCDAVILQVNQEPVPLQPGDGPVYTGEVVLKEGANVFEALDGDGRVSDQAVFTRVDQPNTSYVCQHPAPYGAQNNQVKAALPDGYQDDGVELVIPEGAYSTKSTLGELLDNPETRAVLISFFGSELLDHPMLEMARNFSLERIAQFQEGLLTGEIRLALNKTLTKISEESSSDSA